MHFNLLPLTFTAVLALHAHVHAAFPGGTEIDYCGNETYPLVIDTLSYFRDATSRPTFFINGTSNATITSNATYAFAASFRYGSSPPIVAVNGSVCGNLTETCPIKEGQLVVNLTVPDFPAYYYPAIVKMKLQIFNETLDEDLCIEGPLKSFDSLGVSGLDGQENGDVLVVQR